MNEVVALPQRSVSFWRLSGAARVSAYVVGVIGAYLAMQLVLFGDYWSVVDEMVYGDAAFARDWAIRDLVSTFARVLIATVLVAVPARRRIRLLHAAIVLAIGAGAYAFPQPGWSPSLSTLSGLWVTPSFGLFIFAVEAAMLLALVFRPDRLPGRAVPAPRSPGRHLVVLGGAAIVTPAAVGIAASYPGIGSMDLSLVALGVSAAAGWMWATNLKAAAGVGLAIAGLVGSTTIGDALEYGWLQDHASLFYAVVAIALACPACAYVNHRLQMAVGERAQLMTVGLAALASFTLATLSQFLF